MHKHTKANYSRPRCHQGVTKIIEIDNSEENITTKQYCATSSKVMDNKTIKKKQPEKETQTVTMYNALV